MALVVGAILLGFAMLVWSADRFVAGAAATAKNLGMPSIIIGLTIVAMGTSMPELLVSAEAAAQGSSEIAIGNAIGSNITNIGLVLGFTALFYPICINNTVLQRDLPILLIVTISCILLLLDNFVSRLDAGIMLAALIFILVLLVRSKSHEPNIEHNPAVEAVHGMRPAQAWFWLLFGLLWLIISAKILIWGAREIAVELGISELIIGLTIVAVGTSLPELATTLMGAKNGHHDIAVGNVLGSNLFNLLGIVSTSAMVSPLPLQEEVMSRDYTSMTAITLILAAIVYVNSLIRNNEHGLTRLGRISGLLLLSCYITYCYMLLPDAIKILV